MADTNAALEPATQAALAQLADIAVPQPVSWMPQTWGWVALVAILLALAAWAVIRWRKRREANRYRVEALAELERVESIAEIPPLLKRVTLAAWRREEVARLSGAQWVEFLRRHGEVREDLARLLDDAEYQPAAPGSLQETKQAARTWIAHHRNRAEIS